MIPLRDVNPTRTIPYVNYGLIALNILVFLWEWSALAAGEASFVRQYGVVPAELVETPVREGTTVLTSMFLHDPTSFGHVAFNMLFLYIFGDNVEDALGHARYAFFYLAAGVAAAAAQVWIDPASLAPMIGASGAIGGVLGAYVVLYPRAPIHVLNPILPLWFVLGLVLVFPAWLVVGEWFVVNLLGVGSGSAGVAFAAHIGGFLAGLVMVRPLLRGRSVRRGVDRWRGWRPRPRPPFEPTDEWGRPVRRRWRDDDEDDGPRQDPWIPPGRMH